MTAPLQYDITGSSFLTSTTATPGVIASYSGPAGAFPAGSVTVLTCLIHTNDRTNASKSVLVYDLAVHNIGGTLALVGAASQRFSKITGATAVSGATFAVVGSAINVTGTASQGASIDWATAFEVVIQTPT